jgi:hypothetical protein
MGAVGRKYEHPEDRQSSTREGNAIIGFVWGFLFTAIGIGVVVGLALGAGALLGAAMAGVGR